MHTALSSIPSTSYTGRGGHTCNGSAWKVEARGSDVHDHPLLHSEPGGGGCQSGLHETLTQKNLRVILFSESPRIRLEWTELEKPTFIARLGWCQIGEVTGRSLR